MGIPSDVDDNKDIDSLKQPVFNLAANGEDSWSSSDGSSSEHFNACNALDFLTTEHPKVMSTLPISSSSTHGYGSNTVSVPLAARQECDKELQRVTNAITSFFEEKLHEGELSSSYETGSDGGYEAEPEGNHSRQSSLASSSPGVIRRQATISWDKKPAPSPPSAPNSAVRASRAIIQWVQTIGKMRDNHPDWHGRNCVGRPVSSVHSDRLGTGGSEKETDTEGKAKKWKVVVPLIPLVKGPC
ncbi:hypothetical protein F5888DRAFT_1632954 [Russula emetica]|nr:hypothetical protein F5888DRAFT_1632954 [Russula emetica]